MEYIIGAIAFCVWSGFAYFCGMLHGMRVEAQTQRDGIALYSGMTRGPNNSK